MTNFSDIYQDFPIVGVVFSRATDWWVYLILINFDLMVDFHFDMITRKLKKTKAENQVGYFTLPSTTPD